MTDLPTRQDVVNCYRLALGRDPETEAVIEDKLAQPRSGLLRDFFSSSEFETGVREGVLGLAPPPSGLRTPPDAELKAWTAAFAPLSGESAETVRTVESWAGLYRALFSDARFVDDVVKPEAMQANAAFVAALAVREEGDAASRLEAKVELVTPYEIRGWAVDRADPGRRLGLQLWVDDLFHAAATPDRYRPELQARFGGAGLFGFAMDRPLPPRGSGPVHAELREARSGLILARLQLPAVEPPPADAALALRDELAEVRALLTRIEQRLPDLNEAYSFALANYDDYFAARYAPQATPPAGPPLAELCVVVDAALASPPELDAALASLARQSRPPGRVLAAHPAGELALDFEHVLTLWRGRFPDPQSPRAISGEQGWAMAMQAAAAESGTDRLVVVEARARLAADALERMAAALAAGAALVYADSDRVELAPDGSMGRHHAPALRTAFDAELFLQQGDLGALVGLSRRLVQEVGFRRAPPAAGLYDLVLRAMGRPELGAFVHVPRVLSHLTGPEPAPDTAARAAALRDHLARHAPGAEASDHVDLLGARVTGALRVRRPLPPGARAAVIVPTRDRCDLLEPCLASLAATVAESRTAVEILVVDNQSREPDTFALLQRFSQACALRVIPHDGAFNWALMNNRAAADTDADVLIFLNNDTAALTPDWIDELCSQALRPEVGVVGARLLYADGTIQHAGMVVGGQHAFAAHEGVGAPGSEPGYRGRHALLREVSAVTGACMATRRSVFERLGGFDAVNLPVESNDVDYGFRARAAGLKVLYDPYCTLYHYESKSRGPNLDPAKWRQAEAAGVLLRARWAQTYRCDPFYNPHFSRSSPPLARLGLAPAPGQGIDREPATGRASR